MVHVLKKNELVTAKENIFAYFTPTQFSNKYIYFYAKAAYVSYFILFLFFLGRQIVCFLLGG